MEGVGTNRYAYAGQDPINKSDPSGHLFFGGNEGPLDFWGGLFGNSSDSSGQTSAAREAGSQLRDTLSYGLSVLG